MARFSLLIFCLLWMPSCMSQAAPPPDTGQVVARSSDEQAERDAILKQVQAAIAVRDFAGLSAMEDEFRASRARTPSGIWKLAVLHGGLQFYLADGLKSESGCQYRDAQFLRDWTAASPRNPAPVITDAALLLEQAWCIRGDGYVDTVPADAWPKFAKGAAAAAAMLKGHRTMASADPEYYAVKLNALRAQGVSKSAFHDVIEEATAREPYYHRTYFNAAWYYLPQWGGSDAEVEAFARYAAERTRTSDHSGLYARVLWSLDQCGCQVIDKAADWPTLKQSMRDVYDRYPVPWNGDYFARLSCRKGDTEEGRRYYRAMHPNAVNESAFTALFASCDYEARNAG